MSKGSFMAARNRTMLKAPTMPKDSTTLEVTAKITRVVIMVRPTSVTPKLEEYGKGLFVDEEDKQPQPKGQHQREPHVQQGYAAHIL